MLLMTFLASLFLSQLTVTFRSVRLSFEGPSSFLTSRTCHWFSQINIKKGNVPRETAGR